MSTSIRNHLSGTVENIISDKVVSEIVINTAAGPVTSIITTGSVNRMNLKKGDAVFAIIKATEVSIETVTPHSQTKTMPFSIHNASTFIIALRPFRSSTCTSTRKSRFTIRSYHGRQEPDQSRADR